MEDFLAALADLISSSDLSAIEVIGCLEVAKTELLNDLFTPDEENDDEES